MPEGKESIEDIMADARKKQLDAMKAALIANGLGITALAHAVDRFPKTSAAIAHNVFAVEIHSAPGGFRVRPVGATAAYLGPAPIGVMPPELFGISPHYITEALPFLPHIHGFTDFGGAERDKAFAVQQRVRELERKQLQERLIKGQPPPMYYRLPTLGELEAGLAPPPDKAPLTQADLEASGEAFWAETRRRLRSEIDTLLRSPDATPDEAADLVFAIGELGINLLSLLQAQNPPDP